MGTSICCSRSAATAGRLHTLGSELKCTSPHNWGTVDLGGSLHNSTAGRCIIRALGQLRLRRVRRVVSQDHEQVGEAMWALVASK
eukprot:56861-Heterocapsa_arctica.AAC.1